MTGIRSLVTAVLAVVLTAVTFNVIGAGATPSGGIGIQTAPIAGQFVSAALVSTETILRRVLVRFV